MRSLHSQSATVNLAAGATVLSHTVTTATALADLIIEVGNGVNNLAAAAETTLTVAITIDSVPVRGEDPTETVQVGRTRLRIPVDTFAVAAGEVVAVSLTSDKAADTAVAVTATLRDASPLQPVTKGRQVKADADGLVELNSGSRELVANAVSIGNGEHAVTVTVQDSDSTAIQGARVTVVGTTLKQTSGSDGQVTFNLDAGSYSLRVSSPSGYSDPSDTAVTVDGTESVTITVSVTGTVTPPDSPTLCTLAVLCVDTEGAAEADVTVEAKLVEIPSSGTGVAYTAVKQSATSGADGVATLTLVRLAKYLVKRGTSIEWTEFTVPDAGTAEMTSFIGSP